MYVFNSIVGGGSSEPLVEKDVNFHDYDGTLLYSYTLEEAQELTSLPDGPEHEGLIFQEWNWTLEEIKADVQPKKIGALYTTYDGKTRLYIKMRIPSDLSVSFRLTRYNLETNVGGEIRFDWGDGSDIDTISYEADKYMPTSLPLVSHTYESVGEYIISYYINEPEASTKSQFSLIANTDNTRWSIYHVECGDDAALISHGSSYTLKYLSLTTLSISNTTVIGNTGVSSSPWPISYMEYLKFLVFPRTRILGTFTVSMYDCFSLEGVSFPPDVLCDFDLSSFFTGIYPSSYRGIVRIPSFMKTVNDPFGNSRQQVHYLVYPPTVQTISTYTAIAGAQLHTVDFRGSITVPTLETAYTGESLNLNIVYSKFKILVPAALYDEWVAATNWSVYADYIVPV